MERIDDLIADGAKTMDAALAQYDPDDILSGLLNCPPEMQELVRFPVWGNATFRSLSNGNMTISWTVPSQFKQQVVQLNDRPGLVVWVAVLVPPDPFSEVTGV